ncbi:MAG TPA: chemotaxis protein CheA [Blastocatellia bacterium]|nr:chemotaxis protein CheA [Blastocatellia bacterium]
MKGEIVPDVESGANYFSIEFLDDYYSECEEHLVIVRRALLGLEDFLTRGQSDPSLLEELFRSFHSLKGNSGMVGLREAEQLAHEMESYLRALRQSQVALTADGIEGLVAGTKALELVIARHRSEQPLPEIGPVLRQLWALLPGAGCEAPSLSASLSERSERPSESSALPAVVPELSVEARARLASALRGDARAWKVHFAHSAELANRGVNVNEVRARLQEVGELIQAIPLVTAGAGIAFEFIVATGSDEALLAICGKDGLSCVPYEPPDSNGSGVVPHHFWSNGQAAPPADPTVAMVAPSNVVRVDLMRLDDLMRMVGELVISRARLKDQLDRLEPILPPAEGRTLQELGQTIERQLRDLRGGVMRVRMVPIGEIFERMRFVIRDLARDADQEIHLEISGQETEIDKYLVERLMDPLLHLVRNAVSHGLEPMAEREAQGKPAAGRLRLAASTSGETIRIEIEDDGRGMDLRRIEARARMAGLIGPGVTLAESDLLDVICLPGFSTREEADRASGRGVGMAVVRKAISDCGGALALQARAGLGTRFTIELPLTLAITDALIVTAGGQRYAVPQSVVREVLEVQVTALTFIERNEILQYRGGALPLVRLTRCFGLDETAAPNLKVIVVNSGSHAVGIAVDRILGLREIVVRVLHDPLVQAPGIGGATELGDGRVVLILDAAGLIRARSSAQKEHAYD